MPNVCAIVQNYAKMYGVHFMGRGGIKLPIGNGYTAIDNKLISIKDD